VIAAVGLAVRVSYIEVVMPKVVLGVDAIWYRAQAAMIESGVGYVNINELLAHGRVVPTAHFPPVWPAILAVVSFFGGRSDATFELAGALAGTATIVLTGLIGRRVGGGAVGLVAAAVVALSPGLIAADGSLMSESVFVALMTLAVLVALRAAEADKPLWWAGLGVVLALATLTRSDGLLLAPIVIVATVLGRPVMPLRARLAAVGIAGAAVIAVVTPWVVSRSAALDAPILITSNSGTLLEGANCGSTYAGHDIGLWDVDCVNSTRFRGRPEATTAASGRAAGLEYAREHWDRLPIVGAVRALRLWGLYDPIDQARSEAVESRRASWQILAWAASMLALAFAVAGFVRTWPRRATFAPLIGVIVGVTVVGITSWGNQRFRLAAEPSVAVYAAIGLTALVSRWSAARRPRQERR
jgi:hypothetical protein